MRRLHAAKLDDRGLSPTTAATDLREDGWHHAVQLDGSDQVRMYCQSDLA